MRGIQDQPSRAEVGERGSGGESASTPQLGGRAPWLPDVLALLLLLGAAVVLGRGRWDGLGLLLAAGAALLALDRGLPVQNVLMAAALLAGLAALIGLLGAGTGVPFGPVRFSEALGGKLFGLLPWPVPLLWLVVLVHARGLARLILRPWRRSGGYGFWLIGLSSALAVLFDLGLEPWATQVRGWWSWALPEPARGWFGAPWVNSAGWFGTSALMLLFTTPWLLNKRPVEEPADRLPLLGWGLLNLLLAAANLAHGFPLAAGVTLAGHALAVGLAWRGARR